MPVLMGGISIMKNMEVSPWQRLEFTEYDSHNTINVFHYQLTIMCAVV